MSTRFVRTSLAVVFLGASLTAQLSFRNAQDLPDGQREAFIRAINVGDFSLQELALPERAGEAISVDVVLDGRQHRLNLLPHSVRAPGFQLLVEDETGIHEVEAPAPTTYRGTVAGVAGSVVAANLFNGQLEAQITMSRDLPMLGIQPASPIDETASRSAHLIYTARDNLPSHATCGTADVDNHDHEHQPFGGGDDSGPQFGSVPGYDLVEIACDADREFYQANGSSVNNTENDVENIINAMASVYETEIGITYEITAIIVRTAEPDPYGSSGASSLLNQFANHWSNNQQAIQRDVAHLFTGRNLSGSTIGVAYLNTVCGGNAYGLSQSKYTGNFTNRVGLTAHEIGHNWSAQHCDGQSTCRIMCSCLGCCGPVTTFGFSATQSITNKVNQVSCLDLAPPPNPPALLSLSQSSYPVLSGASLTISGVEYDDITSVSIGSTTLLPGAFIQSGSQVIVTPPIPDELGTVDVVLANLAGDSNSLPLEFVETDPPALQANFAALTAFPYMYTYGGRVGDTAYLLVSVNPTTFNFNGFDILVDLLILNVDLLSGNGIGTFEFDVPFSAIGVTFYSQIATLDPSQTFIGASQVLSTLVPF